MNSSEEYDKKQVLKAHQILLDRGYICCEECDSYQDKQLCDFCKYEDPDFKHKSNNSFFQKGHKWGNIFNFIEEKLEEDHDISICITCEEWISIDLMVYTNTYFECDKCIANT